MLVDIINREELPENAILSTITAKEVSVIIDNVDSEDKAKMVTEFAKLQTGVNVAYNPVANCYYDLSLDNILYKASNDGCYDDKYIDESIDYGLAS